MDGDWSSSSVTEASRVTSFTLSLSRTEHLRFLSFDFGGVPLALTDTRTHPERHLPCNQSGISGNPAELGSQPSFENSQGHEPALRPSTAQSLVEQKATERVLLRKKREMGKVPDVCGQGLPVLVGEHVNGNGRLQTSVVAHCSTRME
jgi:hypothetical protein